MSWKKRRSWAVPRRSRHLGRSITGHAERGSGNGARLTIPALKKSSSILKNFHHGRVGRSWPQLASFSPCLCSWSGLPSGWRQSSTTWVSNLRKKNFNRKNCSSISTVLPKLDETFICDRISLHWSNFTIWEYWKGNVWKCYV